MTLVIGALIPVHAAVVLIDFWSKQWTLNSRYDKTVNTWWTAVLNEVKKAFDQQLWKRQTDKMVIPLVSFVSWSLKRCWSVRDTLFRVLTGWWRILYFDVTVVLMLCTAAFSWPYATRPFMYLWQHKWRWRNGLHVTCRNNLKDAEL